MVIPPSAIPPLHYQHHRSYSGPGGRVGSGSGVGEGVGSGSGVGEGVGSGSGVGEGVGSGSGVGEGVGSGSGVGEGVGSGSGVGEGVGSGSGVGEGIGSGSGVGEGVGLSVVTIFKISCARSQMSSSFLCTSRLCSRTISLTLSTLFRHCPEVCIVKEKPQYKEGLK